MLYVHVFGGVSDLLTVAWRVFSVTWLLSLCDRYNDMIFEALSAVKERNGLDIGSIIAYIEVW